MRKIDYAINSYYKTCSLHIEFAPFWIFALSKITEFMCGYLVPPIPLPRIKITREGEKTTLREYYGNLNHLFHLYVHDPVFQYCCRRMDSRFIDLDYDTARKAFYEKDKKFWDAEESMAEEMKLEKMMQT